MDIESLTRLRQSLHQNPELSGCEEFTSEIIKRMIIKFEPDEMIENLGGYGVAFVFNGKANGPTILFKAELDAIPVNETNIFDYASRQNGVGHQCGHDGHMAILIGLASYISANRPSKGKVVLLFQPSEETGEGAQLIINDRNFAKLKPDFCFSLHNIPGYEPGQVLIKQNTITAAAQGLIIRLTGKTSHASEPGKGISPAIAMSQIITDITNLPLRKKLFNDFVLTTIVHARLGEYSFGTTPGFAEILATVRSYNDEDMQELIHNSEQIVHTVSASERLKYEIKITDVYPSMINHPALTKLVIDKARELDLTVVEMEKPFPWADDFARFSRPFPSVFFGIGAGKDTPQLHNSDYDFPDKILQTGIDLYTAIYRHYLKNL
jgi:amidohydrolase